MDSPTHGTDDGGDKTVEVRHSKLKETTKAWWKKITARFDPFLLLRRWWECHAISLHASKTELLPGSKSFRATNNTCMPPSVR